MYSVSAEYLTALASPVARFRLSGTVGSVSFTDENVVRGTFTINNNVSEGNEVKLGSVYVGQLKATFTGLSIPRGSWLGKVITVSEGLQLADESFEDVPLGIYTVAEAQHTLEGVSVTAYDAMADFDKAFSIDQTNGSPYDLLSLACSECGVTLGNTQAEIENLPNGTQTFYLYSENDIETWRDFVSWIAQTIASVATIDRTGKLVLRQYSITSSMTIDEEHRFSGCAFSDFATHYTGCSVVDVEEQSVRYKSVSPDDGLTYNLGSNPFLQADDGTMQQALIDSFSQMELVPFSAQMLGGAVYDLGDCLTFSGGVANGATCGVMGYSYSYNGGYKVEGYGMNPALADARSKTDKDIAGLISSQEQNKVRVFAYTNAEQIEIADGETKGVIFYHIVATKPTQFVFQAEIKHLAETTETVAADTYTNTDLIISAVENLNGDDLVYLPIETEQDGERLLHLTNTLRTGAGGIIFTVSLECNGGAVTIEPGDITAYLLGIGLEDLEVRDIRIERTPYQYVTYVDEALNFDGLKVVATYQDGSESDITAVCTYDPANHSIVTEEGEITVNVTFEE